MVSSAEGNLNPPTKKVNSGNPKITKGSSVRMRGNQNTTPNQSHISQSMKTDSQASGQQLSLSTFVLMLNWYF